MSKLQTDTDIYLYDRKQHKNTDFNMWMAFPGPESFALSSLGFLWMFKSIDQTDDINIEMIFQDTKSTRISRENLNMFGFSFTFDMDFYNIFSMIEKYGFALKSSDRNENAPIIFAGGPVVTANPEPYSDFFDFFVIGDGEDLNLEAVKLCKENSDKPKSEVLKLLSNLDGIYVPSLKQDKVKKVTKRLTECIYTPIISKRAFFKNTFILEAERGCANRCGFFLVSYLNLPVRFVPYEKIISAIDSALK